MQDYIFQDGHFIRGDQPVIMADNRSFRYGDGAVETLRLTRGSLPLVSLHIERLQKAIAVLQFEAPSFYTTDYFTRHILVLATKNQCSDQARIRLTLYRGSGGLYDPENHFPHLLIQAMPLPAAAWNENGLVLGIYPDARKSCDLLSSLKTNNFLPYVMAALAAKKHHWNDALLLNTAGTIADSTIANIFMVKNNIITTPPLADGAVAGVMRRYLLQQLQATNWEVKECSITPEDLQTADEVFVTNAVHGIRWVQRIGDAVYTHTQAKEIYNLFITPLFN
jgi:aminodeoxychorismate lyase